MHPGDGITTHDTARLPHSLTISLPSSLSNCLVPPSLTDSLPPSLSHNLCLLSSLSSRIYLSCLFPFHWLSYLLLNLSNYLSLPFSFSQCVKINPLSTSSFLTFPASSSRPLFFMSPPFFSSIIYLSPSLSSPLGYSFPYPFCSLLSAIPYIVFVFRFPSLSSSRLFPSVSLSLFLLTDPLFLTPSRPACFQLSFPLTLLSPYKPV